MYMYALLKGKSSLVPSTQKSELGQGYSPYMQYLG